MAGSVPGSMVGPGDPHRPGRAGICLHEPIHGLREEVRGKYRTSRALRIPPALDRAQARDAAGWDVAVVGSHVPQLVRLPKVVDSRRVVDGIGSREVESEPESLE